MKLPKPFPDRYPSGDLRSSSGRRASERRVGPTPELAAKRMEAVARMDISIDHPLEVMFARGQLKRYHDEDGTIAQQRRDAGAAFANLAWHVWGQPFSGIDLRSKRLVPPSAGVEDAEALLERRARQTDLRTPEERAEDVRLRYEAMARIANRIGVRGWVLRKVAQELVPIEALAVGQSKRRRLRSLLLDALDLIGDWREVKRVEEAVRGEWARRAVEAA